MNRKHTKEENQALCVEHLKRRIEKYSDLYIEYRDKYYYGMQEKNELIQGLENDIKLFKEISKTQDKMVKFWQEQSNQNSEPANMYFKNYNEEIKKRYCIETDEDETIVPDEDIISDKPIEQMTDEEINQLIEEKRKRE
jgi:hypothetical protein